MYILYNNVVALKVKDWIAAGLTKNQFEHDSKRGYLKIAKRSQHGNTLIDVKSIVLPERVSIIEAAYGKISEAFKKVDPASLAAHIVPDLKAKDFYDTWKKLNGEYLSIDSRIKYYNNAIILNAIHTYRNAIKLKRRALGRGAMNLWENISKAVNNLDPETYKHTLPGSSRKLQDKFNEYLNGENKDYKALIHKNEGNQVSLKLNDDKKIHLLKELFGDHRNLDDAQILMLYNMVAEPMGWKKITIGTVRNWRDKLNIDTYAGSRGVTAHRNNIAMQVKRTAPTAPLYYWTMDGWDVELLYQTQSIDKKGRRVTTYHNRPTVVIVLDPFNKYPVGYAIGTHETPELIKAALRNAVNHVKELFGARFKPHQLQTDNYELGTLSFLYQTVAEKHTPARVKNAKAKVIEPYFGTINKKYCHLMPNWSGYGVTSGKDKQPNDEYLNKIRHSFPNQQECFAQVEKIISMERAAKLEQYVAAWGSMPQDDKLPLSDEMYLYLFGETTGFTNRLVGHGIVPTICGKEYAFDSFDPSFRNYGYVDWMIKYDPADLTQVLAVNAKKVSGKPEEIGTLRYMLTQKYIQPMALKDRKEGDAAQLAAVERFNKALETNITERRALASETVKELFIQNPQLNNTLAKLVLVDSRGQHKDHKNAIRSAPKAIPKALPEIEEYEIIEDKEEFIRNNF